MSDGWSLGQEALPLLWRAERCGLAPEHWVVEALRGYAAEAGRAGGAVEVSLGTSGDWGKDMTF